MRISDWSSDVCSSDLLSAGPGGEHSLAVGGEGRDPEHKHVMAVAADALISKGDATAIFDQVRSAVRNWSSYAEKAGLSGRRTTEINSLLNRSGYDDEETIEMTRSSSP